MERVSMDVEEVIITHVCKQDKRRQHRTPRHTTFVIFVHLPSGRYVIQKFLIKLYQCQEIFCSNSSFFGNRETKHTHRTTLKGSSFCFDSNTRTLFNILYQYPVAVSNKISIISKSKNFQIRQLSSSSLASSSSLSLPPYKQGIVVPTRGHD